MSGFIMVLLFPIGDNRIPRGVIILLRESRPLLPEIITNPRPFHPPAGRYRVVTYVRVRRMERSVVGARVRESGRSGGTERVGRTAAVSSSSSAASSSSAGSARRALDSPAVAERAAVARFPRKPVGVTLSARVPTTIAHRHRR